MGQGREDDAEYAEIRRVSVGKTCENRSAKTESLALKNSVTAGCDPQAHNEAIFRHDRIRQKPEYDRPLYVTAAKG